MGFAWEMREREMKRREMKERDVMPWFFKKMVGEILSVFAVLYPILSFASVLRPFFILFLKNINKQKFSYKEK